MLAYRFDLAGKPGKKLSLSSPYSRFNFEDSMLPQRWGKRLKIHEGVQRRLCRCVFVAFGILPTFGLLFVAGWSRTPWSVASQLSEWRERMGLQLGFDIEIGEVENRGPRHIRLSKILLRHPESGERLGKVDSVELHKESGGWKLFVPSMQIDIRHLAFACDVIHQRSLCRPQSTHPIMEAVIDRIQIQDDDIEVDAFGLRSAWVCQTQKSQCHIDYKPLGRLDQAGTIDIARWHTAQPPLTQVVLQTGNGTIGYSLLNAFFPSAEQLGPNVNFAGNFEWLQNAQTWNARISGRFQDVSWGQMTSSLPHELTGRGYVDLRQTLIADGRILQMQGNLQAQAGRIGRDWLKLSQDWLGLGVDPDVLRDSMATVSFEAMRIDFQLDGQGLYLQGAIPSSDPNYASSLLADSRDGLVYVREPREPIGVEGLINWIVATPSAGSSPAIQSASHTQTATSSHPAGIADRLRNLLPVPTPVSTAAGVQTGPIRR